MWVEAFVAGCWGRGSMFVIVEGSPSPPRKSGVFPNRDLCLSSLFVAVFVTLLLVFLPLIAGNGANGEGRRPCGRAWDIIFI